jgi:predicted patatin/cPLA2 family phospholipase
MNLENLCIISQGGGVRSIYSAGVIKGLVEKFSLTEVGHVVAPSGSAANFMYYTSGQLKEIEQIWLELIKSGKFVRPFNLFSKNSILNIDFLVDELVRKRFPFDEDSFKNSNTKMYIPVLGASDGVGCYFSNKDQVDPFELMRATCAVPRFYGKKVLINNNYYIDGSIVDSFGFKKAMEIDSENLLVILTEPFNTKNNIPNILIRKVLDFLLFKREPNFIKEKIWGVFENYKKEKDLLIDLKKEKNIFIIAPNKKLPIGSLGRSYESAKKTLGLGYSDVVNNKELEEFILNIKNKKQS